MANTIQLRRSATPNAVPTTTQLALGELAINTTDGKLYLKKNVSGVETIVDVTGGGGASISVSDTAPASPGNGSLWWNSTIGVLKIYYNDGTSSQWIDASHISSAPSGGTVSYPQNIQSGNYTLVLSDAGKHIYSANTGAQTITIPTNASVAFPIGTVITIVNRGTSTILLSISGVSIFTKNFPVSIPSPAVASNNSIQIIKTAENSWVSTFGDFSSNSPTVTYLVVGGGGGGGRYSSGTIGGGGGGGGGFVTGSTSLAGLTIYSVTIGAGGTAATGTGDLPGTNGANSSFNSINGLGGGGGGGGGAGLAGGSGGGGWWLAAGGAAQQPGSSSGGFGNAGGAGSYLSDFTRVTGGSGGGAGAAAANSVNGSAQNGGAGLASSITGTSVTYAGGGAGGSSYSSGVGGTGGGGNPGVAGSTNTGGGAGANATGGSGVVIISSPVAALYVTGSPVVTTSGGSTTYKFTSSGTIAF